tara:strand:- start:217 stop:564 length:348 start_codon:yes stop_codon:yes gene_type:complete
MEGLVAMQNAQISCLHQLVDPEVHIVYITPVAVSAEETAYHDKFLSMLGITTLPKRLHFIQPELIHRLPQVRQSSRPSLVKLEIYLFKGLYIYLLYTGGILFHIKIWCGALDRQL